MARKAKAKPGKVSMQDLMSLVNKKAGVTVAHNLTGDNPTEVKEWIPTGSRWLDSIISKGQKRSQSFVHPVNTYPKPDFGYYELQIVV